MDDFSPFFSVIMNCEEFSLPELKIGLPVVKEALRCLVSTILFVRSIGGNAALEPVTNRSDLFGFEFATSPGTGDCCEAEIRNFADRIEAASRNEGAMTLVLSFFVPRQRSNKSLWDILSQPFDEKAVFERWKIPVSLVKPFACDEKMINAASRQVRDNMWTICKRANERMDHLPAPPLDRTTYHFDTQIIVASAPSSPWSPRSFAQSIKSIPFIT